MKLKTIVVITLFFLLPIIGLSQQFKEGYIIKNNGEELKGYMDFRGNLYNCSNCVFKTNLNSKEQHFMPSEIKLYQIKEGRRYVSRYIESIKDTVFVEFVVKANINIYSYQNSNKIIYFAEKNNEFIELNNDKKSFVTDEVLVNRMGVMKKEKTEFNKSSNQFLGVLKYLVSDSPETLKKVSNVKLNRNSLIRLVKDYNDAIDNDVELYLYENVNRAKMLSFSVYAGVDYSNLKINYVDYNDFEYGYHLNYMAGLDLQITPIDYTQTISFILGTKYSEHSFKSQYEKAGLANRIDKFTSEHSFSVLNNKIGLNYNFPFGKFSPNLYVSYSLGLMMNKNSLLTIEKELATGTDVSYEGEDFLRNTYHGITLGIGLPIIELNKVKVCGKLEYSYVESVIYQKETKNVISLGALNAGLGIQF